jgi:Flp pilus assembly protein TadB
MTYLRYEPPQQHYHQHDYGVGRLLSRIFWWFAGIWFAWLLIVLVFAFPWIMLAVALILASGLVLAVYINQRRPRE